ncbi:MAG TPA: CPCC family cysteine-rich protein [Kofleriaceae bacterium]
MRYPCRCCQYLTLTDKPPSTFAICPVCWWEDDFPYNLDFVGASRVSLREARANMQKFGACEHRFIAKARPPTPEETP